VPGEHPIGAYFETHIEQGPVLEDHDKTIGVVTAVLGIRWYDCTVTGMEAHAGPTPMGLRKDALQVATRDAGGGGHRQPARAARARHGGHGAGAPQQPQRDPGPGQVQHRPAQRSDALVEQMDAEIRAYAAKVAADSGLKIEIELVSHYPAQPFHADCVDAVRAPPSAGLQPHARRLGRRPRRGLHGQLAPAGMIFIPCKDGISHNEIEDAKPEHISAGCNVLLHAMCWSARAEPRARDRRRAAQAGGVCRPQPRRTRAVTWRVARSWSASPRLSWPSTAAICTSKSA
jgi:N-carbamoyl-L-amino-acid hydrolase